MWGAAHGADRLSDRRLSRRVVQRLLEGALHIPISLGSTHAAWEEASDAVAAPCQALEDALAHQPVLNGDETGFRTNGAKRYLWVLVAPLFVVYRLAPPRGAVVLRDLLGPVFAGILGSDRYVSYTSYHKGRLQFCWAHFTRDLLRAQALARRLFRLGHRFQGVPRCRGGPLTRAQLVAKVLPLQRQLFRLAEGALDSPDDDVRNLATALFTQHENFFVFVHHDGVEPTHNRADRALRPAVQWRKIMFGTRSAAGELAVARLLTVMSTCQMRICLAGFSEGSDPVSGVRRVTGRGQARTAVANEVKRRGAGRGRCRVDDRCGAHSSGLLACARRWPCGDRPRPCA